MLRRAKNFTIISLLFLCTSLNSFAWERHSDSTLMAGLRGGLVFSEAQGLELESERFVGFSSGVQLALNFHQEFSFMTGFYMLTRGYYAERAHYNWMNEHIGDFENTSKYTYYNIPATLQYNLGRRKFNVFFVGGIDFNILSNKTRTADLPEQVDGVEIDPYEVDFTNLYKKTSFGYHYGFGLEYKFYPALTAYLQYTKHNDFSDIYSQDVQGSLKIPYSSVNIGVKVGIPITYNVYYVRD